MDLAEVGAESGSCGHRWEGKRTKGTQKCGPSVGKDRVREGGYGARLLRPRGPSLACCELCHEVEFEERVGLIDTPQVTAPGAL
jgi:hypothetical protein